MAGLHKRIRDLPLISSPNPNDFLAVDGDTTGKATLESVVSTNIPRASQAEAETGTENVGLSTPLRVAQQTTARLADQATAEAGANSTKLMTPLRAFQAQTAYIRRPQNYTEFDVVERLCSTLDGSDLTNHIINDAIAIVKAEKGRGSVVVRPRLTPYVIDEVAVGASFTAIPMVEGVSVRGFKAPGPGALKTTFVLEAAIPYVFGAASHTTLSDMLVDLNYQAGMAARGGALTQFHCDGIDVNGSEQYAFGFQSGTMTDCSIRNSLITDCGRDAIDIKDEFSANIGLLLENITIDQFNLDDETDSAPVDIRGRIRIVNMLVRGNPINPGDDMVRIRSGVEAGRSLLTNIMCINQGTRQISANYGLLLQGDGIVVTNAHVRGMTAAVCIGANRGNNIVEGVHAVDCVRAWQVEAGGHDNIIQGFVAEGCDQLYQDNGTRTLIVNGKATGCAAGSAGLAVHGGTAARVRNVDVSPEAGNTGTALVDTGTDNMISSSPGITDALALPAVTGRAYGANFDDAGATTRALADKTTYWCPIELRTDLRVDGIGCDVSVASGASSWSMKFARYDRFGRRMAYYGQLAVGTATGPQWLTISPNVVIPAGIWWLALIGSLEGGTGVPTLAAHTVASDALRSVFGMAGPAGAAPSMSPRITVATGTWSAYQMPATMAGVTLDTAALVNIALRSV